MAKYKPNSCTMARSESGLFSDFTGRIGNLVVYKLNGKTVVRTLPSVPTKPPTALQQQARNDFSHVMKYMQALKPVVSVGYREVARGRSAFHAALSHNLKAYREAGKPTDAGWLILSDGTRAGASNLHLENSGNNQFRITWGDPPTAKPHSNGDRVYVVAVSNSGPLSGYTLNHSSHRQDHEVVITLNGIDTGAHLRFFIFFLDEHGALRKKDPRNISRSSYVGEAVTQ